MRSTRFRFTIRQFMGVVVIVAIASWSLRWSVGAWAMISALLTLCLRGLSIAVLVDARAYSSQEAHRLLAIYSERQAQQRKL